MSKLYAWEFMTIDGVMESPEKWINPHSSEDVWDFIRSENLSADAILLGRKTYEAFLTFWPDQKNNEFGFADKLNKMPKYVVSSTLTQASWNNTRVLGRDFLMEIRSIKDSMVGAMGMTGSATLLDTILLAGLLDELHILVYPTILGSGLRLFQRAYDKEFVLKESRTFQSGVVLMSYEFRGITERAG